MSDLAEIKRRHGYVPDTYTVDELNADINALLEMLEKRDAEIAELKVELERVMEHWDGQETGGI